jgi:sec-independent protein translocase protein TatA
MLGLGPSELVVILLLVVLIFGAAKIPQLGRGLGEGISNFKRGLKEGNDGPTDAPPPTSKSA